MWFLKRLFRRKKKRQLTLPEICEIYEKMADAYSGLPSYMLVKRKKGQPMTATELSMITLLRHQAKEKKNA